MARTGWRRLRRSARSRRSRCTGRPQGLGLALAASLLAGASWTIMMTTLFVSAQVALPDWVRGRGMAILLTAYFGAMTIGSAVWGKVASVWGLPATLYVAAAGALPRHDRHLEPQAPDGRGARPLALDALARPGLRPGRSTTTRGRSWSRSSTGSIPRTGRLPRRDAGDRVRAEARRRLRLERVRGRGRRSAGWSRPS